MKRQTVSMVFVLAISAAAQKSLSATSPALGAAASQLYNTAEPSALSSSSVTSSATQRVRIPVTLKAWNELDARSADGKSVKTKIIGQPVKHVLRARLENSNDFYLGDWRVQTTPIRWLRRSNQYQVKLEVFRRFGESGQLEETMGSVTLTGILDKQDDGLFMLNGTARRVFRDKNGDPILEFDAGQHGQATNATAISRLEPAQTSR
jgi:hypothetical protein